MNLSIINREALAAIGGALLDELDNLVSRISTGWNVQHKPDGSHSEITGDSIEVVEDVGAGGVVTALGDGPHQLGPIELGIGAAGTGFRVGPSIKLTEEDFGHEWSLRAHRDAFDDHLGVIHRLIGETGATPLNLYHLTGSGLTATYAAAPGTSVTEVSLGINLSGKRFHNVVAQNLYAQTAIYERGRAVPMGEWQSYTPTWTDVTIGNGTQTARYTVIGKTVHFSIRLVFGTTTVVTGIPIVTAPLPFPASMAAQSFAHWNAYDNSPGVFFNGLLYVASGTEMAMITHSYGTTAASWVAAGSPFTWAVNDQLWIQGSYEMT